MEQPIFAGGHKVVGQATTVVSQRCYLLRFDVKETNRGSTTGDKQVALALDKITLRRHVRQRHHAEGRFRGSSTRNFFQI